MVTHITRRPEILTSTEPRPGRWRRRLIWLLALLAATIAAARAGIVVAEQLTRSSTVAPAVRPEPTADTQEVAGKTTNRVSSTAAPQAGRSPRQQYLWRPAYVRGKVVLIRIRADAANVREDRGISR